MLHIFACGPVLAIAAILFIVLGMGWRVSVIEKRLYCDNPEDKQPAGKMRGDCYAPRF